MKYSSEQLMELEELTKKVLLHISLIIRLEKLEAIFKDQPNDYVHVFSFHADHKERDELQKQFISIITAYSHEVLNYHNGSITPFMMVVNNTENALKPHLETLRESGYNVTYHNDKPDMPPELRVSRIINVDPLKFAGF